MISPEIYTGLQPKVQAKILIAIMPLTMDRITGIVFDKLGIDFIHAKSHARNREYVEARQIAMYIISLKTKYTLKQIGEYFGGRDHSTVIYARDTVNDLMFGNKAYKAKVEEMITDLT